MQGVPSWSRAGVREHEAVLLRLGCSWGRGRGGGGGSPGAGGAEAAGEWAVSSSGCCRPHIPIKE